MMELIYNPNWKEENTCSRKMNEEKDLMRVSNVSDRSNHLLGTQNYVSVDDQDEN